MRANELPSGFGNILYVLVPTPDSHYPLSATDAPALSQPEPTSGAAAGRSHCAPCPIRATPVPLHPTITAGTAAAISA